MDATHNLPLVEGPGTTQFGRYRLLESIGQGGMANVMVAVIPGPARFNKLLVLKTICEQIRGDDTQYAKMFLDEARLAARLNHQNIVHTYEVGDEKGVYYISMEYLEGQALYDVQAKLDPGGLPLEASLRVLIETANGLHHAHELTDYAGCPLHVVHRDVSPQNIFLTYDGQVKLLDFGIAKMRDAETVTLIGQIKGKLDYMAPEQLQGEPIDRTADVFALGAILWELLAGRPMSGGRDTSQITRVHNRLTNKEPSIGLIVPELDAELARICDKAVSHDRGERYASALEFACDLQEYMAQRSLAPTAEQLAAILQPAFEQERAERRKRIEAALANIDRDPGTPSLAPVFDSGGRPTASGKPRPAVDNENGQRPEGSTQADTKISELAAMAQPKRHRSLQALSIAAVLAAVTVWSQLGSEPKAAKPAPVPRTQFTVQAAVPSPGVASQGAQPVDAPQASDDTVTLTIVSSTPQVQVLLDGALVPQLPFEAELAKDHAIHKLVASAPGRQSITQVLTLDRDLEVVLDPPPAPKVSFAARNPKRRVGTVPQAATTTSDGSRGEPAGSDGLSPGQEMEIKARQVGEMSDEDPYR